MLTTFYPPYSFGGDGIGIQRLAQALVRRGHHVTVVHDVDAYNLLSPTPNPSAQGAADGVEVVRLRSRCGPLSPVLTQQLGRPVMHRRRIARLLVEGAFDVIWYQNVSLVGGPGILARGNAVKIYEAHEHWLICPTHVLWRHAREPCTGRQCLRCTLRHRRPPQVWRFTGYLERKLAHIDAFIAKSEFSRNKHYEFGFPRSMDIVPCFLSDAEDERAAGPEPAHERPYFLFVGRLERPKGLDDIIPLFTHYLDADLLIAGDGAHGSALRRLAGGIPNVRFLGRVEPSALTRLYRGAIALIMPSIGYETFGIAVIEAFRQSTPALVRRTGPLPEIVQTCGGGVVFHNPSELLEAMRRLQHDPTQRDRMATAAATGFARYWSEHAVMPQYLDVVRSAAIRGGRTRLADRVNGELVA
jgi:glycosyltransferase involved in cell wall biosynthesis